MRRINTNNPTVPLLMTWKAGNKQDFEQALAKLSVGYKGIEAAQRTTASAQTFRNVDSPHISVRDGYNRLDFDYFRPGERLPADFKGIQAACRMAYRQFSLVRNMIDMMTDFIIKGISVVHRSPKIQEFGRLWFKKVAGKDVSSKIVRRLLREGAAPIRRRIQKINDNSLDGLTKASQIKSPLGKNEIPSSYNVLNPMILDAIGGELAQFVDDSLIQYGIKVPATLMRQIKNPKNGAERKIVQSLRPDIMNAATTGDQIVPVPPNRLVMLHYKKDDDELWATPFLYSILDDLQMLQKLKLADRSALDGAISHIRLWKMGNIAERIIPSPEGIQTLADILLHSTGGGCMDLVWGPDLELVETKSDMYQFLGSDKYQATMIAIYQGLGVPPSLTGTINDTGTTNNFVSLRVLVERLQYCRELLFDFWFDELEILRSVFGFRHPFSISFAVPTLSDDSAEKKLLIDLVDRDVISGIFVQERFGADPEIEQARMRQENRKRESGILPPKAGQFHIDSQQNLQLQKIFAQQGEVTPSEVGVKLKPKLPGEVPSADKNRQTKKAKLETKKNPKTNGRPIGTKDTIPRKKTREGPRQNSKAALTETTIWANAAFNKIDEFLKDSILKLKNKTNMRQLTDEETKAYEDLKLSVLCNHEVGSDVTEESVKQSLNNYSLPLPIKELTDLTIAKYIDKNKEKPSLDQIRQIRVMAYAMYSYEDLEDLDGVNTNEE